LGVHKKIEWAARSPLGLLDEKGDAFIYRTFEGRGDATAMIAVYKYTRRSKGVTDKREE